VSGLGFRVPGFWSRVSGFGFRTSGLVFRVSSFGIQRDQVEGISVENTRAKLIGAFHNLYDAVKSYRPVELTFHEPVSREIRDGLASTSQRTAVMPAKAPAHRCPGFSFSVENTRPKLIGAFHNLFQAFGIGAREVDTRRPGKENSNSHGASPIHLIITMKE